MSSSLSQNSGSTSQFDSVPAELRNRDQWVAWRYEQRNGKPTKPPMNAHTGGPASSTDPETWASFDQAVSAVQQFGFDGVGFVVTEDDPLFAIDLDGIRDGDLVPWADAVVRQLDTYAELSPSGTGVHIWGLGSKPGPHTGPKPHPSGHGKVEIYDKEKFITITGRVLNERPIRDAELGMTGLYFQVFGSPVEDSQDDQLPEPTGLSDADVIAKALTAKNGDKFQRLFIQGDRTGYDSESEADAALAMMIGFYTGGDVDQVERIMRRSGLVRDKWDRRGSKSYLRDEIIVPALLKLDETFSQPSQVL